MAIIHVHHNVTLVPTHRLEFCKYIVLFQSCALLFYSLIIMLSIYSTMFYGVMNAGFC